MARAILLAWAEEERKKNLLKRSRRLMRDASDPLALPSSEFVAQFRLTKDAFCELCQELRPFLRTRKRSTMIRDELKILAALSFFACGSYQRNIASSYLHNMSQPSFCNCLDEVTNALNSPEILKKFIKFPSSRRKREDIMTEFMNINGMPGVVGCIDGTHIAIIRPIEYEEAYFNRKGYHSLNVLAICDANLTILHIDASYGGAAHDSFVWAQSPIKAYLENLNLNGETCWLLGDSGFAQRPYMMTPILRAAEGSPEDLYTKIHCSTRNVVERCFGVMKARWRCLLSHRVLHYNPRKAGKIVNACVVLHNISNARNVPIPQMTDSDQEAIQYSLQQQQYSMTCMTYRMWQEPCWYRDCGLEGVINSNVIYNVRCEVVVT